MRWLRSQHEEGAIRPSRIEGLRRLPDDAPTLICKIYDDLVLMWGLRLGQLDDRPLPYATSTPVQLGMCAHTMQASRALHWLEERAFIWSPGSLEPIPRFRDGRWRTPPDGTRTFLPGEKPAPPDVLPAGAGAVEANLSALGQVDQREEPPQHVTVGETVADDGREVLEADDLLVAP